METENNCKLPSPPEEALFTVYKLSDPEGKIYIGVTGKTVEERWNRGRGYPKKLPIRKAIDYYGWGSFKKEVLCEKMTREGAEKLERWFIAYYDSSDPEKGYNRFLGGLGKGARMSEITKELAREAKNKLYEEHPEVKERIRNTVNNLFASDPTYRKRVGEGVLKAHEKDPTIKVRLSEISKEYWQNPEFRERCSSARRKASEDPELARRQSMIHKNLYDQHPERREEISRQMRVYLSEPENRAFLESDKHAKPVICVETGEYYPSQMAAEKATGYSGIHKACAGKQYTASGYHWRYASEEERQRVAG